MRLAGGLLFLIGMFIMLYNVLKTVSVPDAQIVAIADSGRLKPRRMSMNHEIIEKNAWLLGTLIAVVISVGGLVEIVPLYFQASVISPSPGIKPYGPLELEGRDIYVREGCYLCHTQMVRPLQAEVERYGHYSIAGEAVYDHPFQFGSKRTGPDLARVGGRYSDRVASHSPEQPARRRAGVEHAGLHVAREEPPSTARTSRRRCACCARSACRTPTQKSRPPPEVGRRAHRIGCASRLSAEAQISRRDDAMIDLIRGLITLVLLILFIAYALWAWSDGRKKTFERTARMPLEEDARDTCETRGRDS